MERSQRKNVIPTLVNLSWKFQIGLVHEQWKNIARTTQMFGVDRKQVRTWLKNEKIIQQQKPSSKASGKGCTAKYPIMEDALYAEYIKKQEPKENF